LIGPVQKKGLALVIEDLGLHAAEVATIGEQRTSSASGPRTAVATVPAVDIDPVKAARELTAFARKETSEDGALLVLLEGQRSDRQLAGFRNALWPFAHVVALYRLTDRGIARQKLAGTEALGPASGLSGTVLVAHRRERVLAPDATVAKFDQNAAGWDGKPGSPGYAHFRWMRRYVGTFAPADWMRSSVRRILDFGCGAGWVGIEAALAAPGAELCAFDPSPEMLKIAAENARKSGIAQFSARAGFGEDPPFPAAGEPPFDLVISSGVISFSPHPNRWLDGLARTVAPAGKLVVGDANRESKGMRERRETKPLLPVREMNAQTREEVREGLEERGFAFEDWAGYQLSSPVPELMHWSERRLAGALNPALLLWNKTRAGRDRPERFDSWVMRLSRP